MFLLVGIIFALIWKIFFQPKLCASTRRKGNFYRQKFVFPLLQIMNPEMGHVYQMCDFTCVKLPFCQKIVSLCKRSFVEELKVCTLGIYFPKSFPPRKRPPWNLPPQKITPKLIATREIALTPESWLPEHWILCLILTKISLKETCIHVGLSSKKVNSLKNLPQRFFPDHPDEFIRRDH